MKLNDKKVIGIVGAGGDLGSHMLVQACARFVTVHAFDIAAIHKQANVGVDPELNTSEAATSPEWVSSLEHILTSCDIIHWCAPSSSASAALITKPSQLVIFHDSVMTASQKKLEELTTEPSNNGAFAVVHCLMNAEKRVVIASNTGASNKAYVHVQELGLEPLLLTTSEHDRDMAHSQAVFAVLVKSLLPDILRLNQQGMLTASAHELLKALQHREATWTPATMSTMLSNPELPKLIDTLKSYATNNGDSRT